MGQLWDLWSRWIAGQRLDETQLWGWSIITWGRIGKLLQFAAGLAVILDLIGPESLRNFGRRLSTMPWSKNFRSAAPVIIHVIIIGTVMVYGILFILVSLFSSSVHVSVSPKDNSLDKYIEDNLWPGSIAALFLITALILILFYMDQTGADKNDWGMILFLAPPVALGLAIVTILLLPGALFIYGFCIPVSRGLAVLLDRARPAHPARWVAFVLFIVGFHFDMLAS